MVFSEIIVLEVLEKRGYKSPSLVRSTKHCRWYNVRRNDALFEVETYDSTLGDSETMRKYLGSLRAVPADNPFVRGVEELICERGVVIVVRPLLEGEPLYSHLLRPGKMAISDSAKVIKAFEAIQQYLNTSSMENFAPLAMLFYLHHKPQEGVVLDSRRCGPWINEFDDIGVIYNYLNPELSWTNQINYFRNSLVKKLLLGTPIPLEDEVPATFEGDGAIKELLNGAIKDPENYKASLSVLERKHRPRAKGSVRLMFLAVLIIGLPIGAFQIRQFQSHEFWQGGTLNSDSESPPKIVIDDKFGFDVKLEDSRKITHAFRQRILVIERLMTAGDFLIALNKLNVFSEMNLSLEEEGVLSELKVTYAEKRRVDFVQALERSQALLAMDKIDLASWILKDIQRRYGVGAEFDRAGQLIGRIELLKVSYEQDGRAKQKLK